MQYTVACFDYSFAHEWEKDLFEQQLADIGFEAFNESEAYIQTAQFDLLSLQTLVDSTPGVTMIDVRACEDANWNAVWDAEHADQELALGVHITPCCAFGAGHHETTSMMIEAMIEAAENYRLDRNAFVLDMGCGTGVLGIMAKKCGAAHVVAVDIDDKSVANTLENAAANYVELDVRLGDAPPEGEYHFIFANIHRNILVAQIPLYAQYLKHGGEAWLSGFYADDIPYLIEAADAVGLQHVETRSKNEWQWIRLKK